MHELGHLIGGFSQGFRSILLVVGPLRLEREQQRDSLRLSLNRDLELAGGVAACMPTTDHDLVRRMSVMVGAGPATSLLLGALAIIAVVTLPLSWWSIAVTLFGVSSLIIGLVTAIPMNNGSFMSDGQRFVQLRANGPAARRDVALLTLTMQDQIGVPIGSPCHAFETHSTPLTGPCTS